VTPSINDGAPPANSLSNDRVAAVEPQAGEKTKSGAAQTAKAEPFFFCDFTWLNGNSRTKDTPYATSFFTPEVRADVDYNYSFNHPKDDTIGGSSEVFRHGEVQVTQLGVGGDFHYDNVRARLMTQFGMYSQTTPRNDASPARGQWQLTMRIDIFLRRTGATTSTRCMDQRRCGNLRDPRLDLQMFCGNTARARVEKPGVFEET